MKKSHRYITSLFLTAIYLLIIFSPLVSFALQAQLVTTAVMGECSGDCRTDHCSPERSAAHTCCCWQKKLREQRVAAAVRPAKTGSSAAGCCAKSAPSPHEENAEMPVETDTTAQRKITTIRTKPCASGKLIALGTSDDTIHLPFIFAGDLPAREQLPLETTTPDRLISRPGDPPDPPPERV